MKEIKCYTCKYKNLDPVPEDLPCVDCWNEMDYVSYEPKTIEELKQILKDKKKIFSDWMDTNEEEMPDEIEKLVYEGETIVMEIIRLELNKNRKDKI